MKTHTSIISESVSRAVTRSNQEIFELEGDVELEWYQRYLKNVRSVAGPPPTNRLMESTPYKLVVTRLSGLRINKKSQNNELYARLTCVLASGTNQQLLSNTCIYVHEQNLEEEKKGTFVCQKPLVLYYHSNLDRNHSDAVLLLELSIVEVSRVVEMVHPIGYCLLQPLAEAREKTEQVFKGSWLSGERQPTGVDLRYTLGYYMELKNVVRVVPSEVLLTCNEEVPCLLNLQVPNSPQRAEVAMSRSCLMRIRHFDVFVPLQFEQEILRHGMRYKDALVNNTGDRGANKGVTLKRRKLKLGFHNSWRLVGEIVRSLQTVPSDKETDKNYVVLQAIDDDDQLDVEVWKGVYGVFMMVLVYELEIVSKDFNEILEVETALLIRGFTGRDHSEKIDESMMKGPGRGLNSNLIALITDKLPQVQMQYELVERRQKQRPYTANKMQRSLSSVAPQQRELEDQMSRLEQERQQFEKQKEMFRQQLELVQQKTRQRMEEELEQERLAHKQRQEKLKSQYQQQVDEVYKQRYLLELQIQQMTHNLEIKEATAKRELQLKEEAIKLDLAAARQQVQQEDLPAFNRLPPKNRRQMHISEALYESLEKRLPPPPKKAEKIKVDVSEYERYREANRFSIHFVNVSDVAGATIPLPRLFYFVVKFFNMPAFRTDNIMYLFNQHLRQLQNVKLVKEAYFSHNQQNMDPVYEFVVDPSLHGNPVGLHKDYIDYLANKKLIIDVFNAQSHMYMGQLNISLHDLLRGKRERAISAKEYSLILEGQHYASLQLVLSNEREECSRQVLINTKTKQPQKKNRTVSNHPIVIPTSDLSKMQQTFHEQRISSIGGSSENRQEQRIRLLKERKAAERTLQQVGRFSQTDNQQKEVLLQHIEAYKKLKKPEYIREVYSDFLTDHKSISSYFGKAAVFCHEFINAEDRPNGYRIEIQDPDKAYLTHPELMVIKQPLEWRHFCQLNSWPMPKSFDMISDSNLFYLHPGERLTILFKFISFRQARTSDSSDTDSVGSRMLNALITKQSNSKLVGGFTLKVEPHQQVVDQNYITFQNGDEPVEIILPVLYHSPEVNKAKPTLVTTHDEASVNWLNEYEISLQLQSPPVMARRSFNVLLYDDQYMHVLRENWKVEINSYEAVSVMCKPHSLARFRLAVPQGDGSRRVELYASDPHAIEFDAAYQQGFSLSEGSITIVSCTLKGDYAGRAIIVHCISLDTLDLLYGWRVQALAWQPHRISG